MTAFATRIAHAVVLAAAVASGAAEAQISVSSTAFAYTQDFNALTSATWANNSTLPGWFLYRQPAPGTAITAIGSDSGGSGAGNFYSYGSSAGERALGGLGSGGAYFGSPTSGNVAGWIALAFTNNSGVTLTEFTLGFDGEQWRHGGTSAGTNSAAQTMVLEYGFGATLAAVTTWTAPGANFDWASPVFGTPTAAAVDGNGAGVVAARGGSIGSLNWTPGQTLWLRWVERNDTNNDHGLAIDNLNFGVVGGGPAGIVPVCPATVETLAGTAIDIGLSATDADSIVDSAVVQSGNVAGMSLINLSASPSAGGTATVTLSLANTVTAGSYPVVVQFGNDSAQTATCTINVTVIAAVGYTPIYQIQGTGTTAALTGVRTTQGVVTKVNNNGYYLQDPVGDGNPLTSDGIFVFTSSMPTVSVGQRLQITGTVVEFNTGAVGNAATQANTVTEFNNVTSTLVLGSGTVSPTPITLPVAVAGDLERYEGMLVQITSPLTTSQNFFQGRYGQVTLAAGGRLVKPTNIHRPGTPQGTALADLNARSVIMLDDGTSLQNPNPTPYIGADNTLRAGDTLPGGITGVIDYGLATSSNEGLAMYRIHPTVAPAFTRSNARTATPPGQGGNVKVASFNVLNFFTTFTDGTTADGQTGQGCSLGGAVSAGNCRGADNQGEFMRQRVKIVQAMAAIGADVYGLMEIQNNGNIAAQNLVDALNAVVGANTYAVVPLPPSTGTDAIRVAMIHKPATLALSGTALSDSNPVHNRPPMAQTFSTAGGQKFSVVVNHFKSKGSCPATGDPNADQGDGQGCWNVLRTQQSAALLTFIDGVKLAATDDDVIVIGDLNAYGKEDPIDALTAAGLVDESSRFDSGAYSYVFDGEAGYLDHALATPTLSAQVTGAAHWHINADEPSIIDYNLEFKQPACATCGPDYHTPTAYRSSDHDPVVIGLNLGAGPSPQTITFPVPAAQVAGDTVTLVATASSGLAVSFGSLTPAVCTVSGTLASTLTAGTCTLTGSQPGSAQYQPAPQVQVSFAVGLAGQTLSFASPGDRVLSAGAFTATASASSGLVVSLVSLTPATCAVSGQTVTPQALGVCTLRAEQAGNAGFAAAVAVTQSFSILAAQAPVADGDVPLPPWALAALGVGLLAAMRRARRQGADSGA